MPSPTDLSIVSARNGREAFEVAREHAPDLVICDIDLGDATLDGYAVTSGLRVSCPTAYVCHHSNRFGPDSVRRSLASGVNVVCPKPLGRRQLLDMLQNAMTHRGVPTIMQNSPLLMPLQHAPIPHRTSDGLHP